MKSLLILLTIFSSSLIAMENEKWPNLNDVKSISGRIATKEDVNEGAAVFILENGFGESTGEALNILIPQYGIHTDTESGVETKVVIIQAETADNNKYIGAKVVGGKGRINVRYIRRI